MKNDFFDEVITENALNERFDKILLKDNEYIILQNNVSAITNKFDSLNLSTEQKKLIDKLIVAYTQLGTYFGKATYKQGFRDCAELAKNLYLDKNTLYNNEE